MMRPGMKGRLSPQVMDELIQFLDSQGGESEPSAGAQPAVEVEIEAKPPGMGGEMGEGQGMGEGGEKMCPHCGKPY